MTTSLVTLGEVRVSSVLDRNPKEFGKQFMFDGSPETCWNSDSRTPQWVMLQWPSEVVLETVTAQFQGGFCGGYDTDVEEWKVEENKWEKIESWHLEDIGDEQSLQFKNSFKTNKIRLKFNSSTDVCGRIIIYKLDVLGKT